MPPRASIFALFLLAGCGSAPAPDLHEAFRRIQVHEATIANRETAVTACGERRVCVAVDEACAASEEICTIAAEIDDPDAHARCRQARRRCAGSGAQ